LPERNYWPTLHQNFRILKTDPFHDSHTCKKSTANGGVFLPLPKAFDCSNAYGHYLSAAGVLHGPVENDAHFYTYLLAGGLWMPAGARTHGQLYGVQKHTRTGR
jgi:hypothetical protein